MGEKHPCPHHNTSTPLEPTGGGLTGAQPLSSHSTECTPAGSLTELLVVGLSYEVTSFWRSWGAVWGGAATGPQ